MFFSKYIRRGLILPLLALAGCVQQPLSSVDRTKYKTVALDPTIKVPDHYVYRDITGKRSRGIVGGVLELLIGAASEGPDSKDSMLLLRRIRSTSAPSFAVIWIVRYERRSF
jgi:hypothetical protein